MSVMVLSARLFGFVQDWYKIGRLLTNSILQRKHTKYALLLGHVLLMEAERSKNLDELWKYFGIMLQKLGFSRVVLKSEDREREWKVESPPNKSGGWTAIQEVRGKTPSELMFFGNLNEWDEGTCNLIAEITAESWAKAVARWRRHHEVPNLSSPR